MMQPAFKIPELAQESVDALMFAASLAFKSGKFDNALRVYRGAAVARPAWSRPQVGIGASLYSLGQTEEAEAAYLKALALNANDQEAHLYLGELIWNERQDAGTAETHLAAAFKIQPRTRIGERARFILAAIKTTQEKTK